MQRRKHRTKVRCFCIFTGFGLYDGALQAYLADHPQIKRIELCLDADGPGREAARQFQNKYTAMGYAVTVEEPRSGKDWNEYLQKRKTPERGR